MSSASSTAAVAARVPRATTWSRATARWMGPAWLWALLLLIILAASVSSEHFLTSRNIANILRQSVALGIVAVGQTFVILTGGIDISVAAVIGMSNTLLMGLVDGDPARIPLGLAAALLAGLVVGLVNGAIVFAARVPPFIVTLATASMVTGITFLYTDQSNIGSPAPQMSQLGFASWGPIPLLFMASVIVAGAALIIQNRTVFGRHVYAVGGSEDVGRQSGISTWKVRLAVYAVSGVLAALAGAAISMRMGSGEPLSGVGFDWDSIAAVVIGGTALAGGRGGVGGTIGGVAIIAILNNVMNLLAVSPFSQIVVKGAIVLLAVLLSALAVRRAAQLARSGRWRSRRRLANTPAGAR